MTTTAPSPGPRSLPDHGTVSRYKYHGCKCLPCMDRWRDYQADSRRQKAYGTWQPLVDAAPIRTHVRTLMAAGLGIRRIAEQADISTSAVARLLYGKQGGPPTQQMQRATATKILAVRATPDTYAAGAPVDATGTRRRLQALTALGWSNTGLALQLGMHSSQVGYLQRTARVTARMARDIAAGYDRLWDTDPILNGVSERAAANARRRAAEKGWAPPLAWDDDTIDDPAAEPDYGDPRNRNGTTAAEIAWLLESGETDAEVIAARVDRGVDAVKQAIQRTRKSAVAVAS